MGCKNHLRLPSCGVWLMIWMWSNSNAGLLIATLFPNKRLGYRGDVDGPLTSTCLPISPRGTADLGMFFPIAIIHLDQIT